MDGSAPGEIEPGAMWLVVSGTTTPAVSGASAPRVPSRRHDIAEHRAVRRGQTYTAGNGLQLIGFAFSVLPVAGGGIVAAHAAWSIPLSSRANLPSPSATARHVLQRDAQPQHIGHRRVHPQRQHGGRSRGRLDSGDREHGHPDVCHRSGCERLSHGGGGLVHAASWPARPGDVYNPCRQHASGW